MEKCFRFKTYWKDELTADIDVQESDVSAKRYVLHPAKQLFYKDRMTRYELGNIFRSRCYEIERSDMVDILKAMNLDEYDVYQMCRITHGSMQQDNIWFLFEGEDYTWDRISKYKA